MNKYWLYLFLLFFQSAQALDIPDAFHIDQDLFVPKYNEDRNYTMGVQFEWFGNGADDHPLGTFALLRVLNRFFSVDFETPEDYSVTVGNAVYTPDDLSQKQPVTNDRPYASLLYSGSTLVSASSSGKRATGSTLIVGVLGLSLSEQVQSLIHDVWRNATDRDEPVNPEGWDNQVSDGGELTFLYRLTRFRRIPLSPDWADAAWSWDASLGYNTSVSVGGALRLGNFDRQRKGRFWQLITGLDTQGDGNKIPGDAGNYVTLGLRARAVGYNALLQCQFRDSAHCLGGSDIERLVLETAIGFTASPFDNWQTSFTCHHRTQEHKLREGGDHAWCGINFARNH